MYRERAELEGLNDAEAAKLIAAEAGRHAAGRRRREPTATTSPPAPTTCWRAG